MHINYLAVLAAAVSTFVIGGLWYLAAEFQMTSGQVTGLLAQARRAFRVHTVAELKALCASAEEFRREARDLLGLEVE